MLQLSAKICKHKASSRILYSSSQPEEKKLKWTCPAVSYSTTAGRNQYQLNAICLGQQNSTDSMTHASFLIERFFCTCKQFNLTSSTWCSFTSLKSIKYAKQGKKMNLESSPDAKVIVNQCPRSVAQQDTFLIWRNQDVIKQDLNLKILCLSSFCISKYFSNTLLKRTYKTFSKAWVVNPQKAWWWWAFSHIN